MPPSFSKAWLPITCLWSLPEGMAFTRRFWHLRYTITNRKICTVLARDSQANSYVYIGAYIVRCLYLPSQCWRKLPSPEIHPRLPYAIGERYEHLFETPEALYFALQSQNQGCIQRLLSLSSVGFGAKGRSHYAWSICASRWLDQEIPTLDGYWLCGSSRPWIWLSSCDSEYWR